MTTILIAIMFIVGIYVGLILPYHVTRYVAERSKEKEINSLVPSQVDDYRLCRGRHNWLEAISVNEKGDYEPLNICRDCGFIPTKHLMASEEGLKRIIQNHTLREFEESVQRDFENKENDDIQKLLENELKNGLTYEKVSEIYRAGQTCHKRYIIYKIARSEEKRREPKDNV